MGLAAHVARRFGRRGPSDDDLRQVAFLALVKAVDRFDPDRNVAFSTFAGRTIEGEIKRHFRDHTWTVRVPRSTKETHLRLRRATDELTQRLGRSPTVPQLAEHLGIDVDEVLEGIAAGSAYSTASLDAPVGDDGDGARQLGAEDEGFGHVADVSLVTELMTGLPDARAGDRPLALLRGAQSERDRRPRRDLADARLAPVAAQLRGDAADGRDVTDQWRRRQHDRCVTAPGWRHSRCRRRRPDTNGDARASTSRHPRRRRGQQRRTATACATTNSWSRSDRRHDRGSTRIARQPKRRRPATCQRHRPRQGIADAFGDAADRGRAHGLS